MSRNALSNELRAIVGEHYVLIEKEDVIVYEQDGSIFQVMPEIVVLPANVEQVSAVIKAATRANVPIVPRGSATGLGGGAVPDAQGDDPCGIFVGLEGTVGIVAKIVVRLMKTRESVRTLLAVFDQMDHATQTGVDSTGAGIIPAALEMVDRTTIEAVERGAPVGLPRDAEAVLIVEVEGVREQTEKAVEVARGICQRNGAREARMARDESERQLLWKGRKGAFGAMGD